MTATTTLTTWVLAFQASDADPRHAVINALGEYGEDYDVDGLTTAWVDALDDAMPTELTLTACGEVYGPYRWDGDAAAELRDAMEAVDFWALAEAFDRTTAGA